MGRQDLLDSSTIYFTNLFRRMCCILLTLALFIILVLGLLPASCVAFCVLIQNFLLAEVIFFLCFLVSSTPVFETKVSI